MPCSPKSVCALSHARIRLQQECAWLIITGTHLLAAPGGAPEVSAEPVLCRVLSWLLLSAASAWACNARGQLLRPVVLGARQLLRPGAAAQAGGFRGQAAAQAGGSCSGRWF